MSASPTIEYRVCWSASSNISFHGHTEWTPWDGFEETEEEVQAEFRLTLDGNDSTIGRALEEALDASGFECWVETREAATDTQEPTS